MLRHPSVSRTVANYSHSAKQWYHGALRRIWGQSGRRVFEVQAIAQLKFIRRCRDLGFSLTDIKALSSLRLTEEATCSEAQAIGECHLKKVRTKIRDLEALETALAQLLTHCREGRPNCAMLDKLFED